MGQFKAHSKHRLPTYPHVTCDRFFFFFISVLLYVRSFWLIRDALRVQELCESRGSRPGLSVLTSLMVSVDVKQYRTMLTHWSQLVPNSVNRNPRTLSNTTAAAAAAAAERRSCVKVKMAVLGSPSLIVLMVSVDVKQH